MMYFTSSALVVLILAVTANASVIPLITSVGLTQQTVDLNGVRGVLLSGHPANLVLASPAVLGGQSLIVSPPVVHVAAPVVLAPAEA